MKKVFLSFLIILFLSACSNNQSRNSMHFSGQDGEVKLIVIDPGHFHASLLQKNQDPRVNETIHVYAPAGDELNQYIAAIESFNNRPTCSTNWKLVVYEGEDYLQKAMDERAGNLVVLAGNNQYKTKYITAAIDAGLHVLSDKPMAINSEDFKLLQAAYQQAEEKGLYLYDLMTERYDVLNIVEKRLINDEKLFGVLEKGTIDEPAIVMESVHHFYKMVDGKVLTRPAWYYDVAQQGEGIADVTTHLIDLINWKCFPNQAVDYHKDLQILDAQHWATPVTKQAFQRSTKMNDFPKYLDKYVKDSVLYVNANGTINYQIKAVHVGLKVRWDYQAQEGGGDTFSSVIKGSKANLITIQDATQGFTKQLYIERNKAVSKSAFMPNLILALRDIQQEYPFVWYEEQGERVLITIPMEKRLAHEVHFGYVAESLFDYLAHKNMPDWENMNTLAKYFITTTATEIANR